MKKTIITTIAVSLCALTAGFCFTGCGNTNTSSTATASAATATAAAETTEAAKSALAGTWESVEAPGTSYTFNEDGTGSIDGTGYSTPFNYTDKGDKIVFTYEGSTAGQESKYTIKNDTLSITSDDSTTLTYKKTDKKKAAESSAVAQPDSKLLGTWQSTDEDADITFNEDGTGSIKAKATETKFTFEDKGESVEVKLGNTDPQTSAYKIEDGKLTMTAADGTVSHFTKK